MRRRRSVCWRQTARCWEQGAGCWMLIGPALPGRLWGLLLDELNGRGTADQARVRAGLRPEQGPAGGSRPGGTKRPVAAQHGGWPGWPEARGGRAAPADVRAGRRGRKAPAGRHEPAGGKRGPGSAGGRQGGAQRQEGTGREARTGRRQEGAGQRRRTSGRGAEAGSRGRLSRVNRAYGAEGPQRAQQGLQDAGRRLLDAGTAGRAGARWVGGPTLAGCRRRMQLVI